MFDLQGYFIPVSVFGAGIAVDVAITTISRFKNKKLTFVNWALFLAATHTLFPAFSYSLFWGTATISPKLYSLLGILGFLFISAVVYEIVCEALGTEPRFSLTDKLSHFFGVDRNKTRHFAIVLSVSWDALLCGPALLPMARSNDWSVTMMFFAFLIFGSVVALTGSVFLHLAKRLRERNFSDVVELATFNLAGTFFELSVICGFGLNSLWSAFSSNNNVYWSIGFAAYFMFTVFIAHAPTLWQTASDEATESIEDK